ncbi:MAG: hypothetical protein Q9210_002517 [Variospora velana]
MDINSLLSPQESPRDTPPPARAPPKKQRKPRSAKPSSKSSRPPPALAPNTILQRHQQIISSPPMMHPTSATLRAPECVSDGGRPSRQGSTAGMDTLADLASMQHHQQTTRANAGGLRSTEIYDNQGSANSAVLTNVHGVHGALPARASLDHMPGEASSLTASARTFTTKALSEAELQTVAQLNTYLATNQFAYESHVELIDLLHRGYRSHTHSTASSPIEGDPRTYDLLADLRAARESMDARFAVGERLWVDWIEDEKLLATTFDECFTVMELCNRAVQQEAGSTKLWSLYAYWITSLYVVATGDSSVLEATESCNDAKPWSDEDRLVAAEVCNWQQLIDVWARGASATKWRVDESQLLWDPYTKILLLQLGASPRPDQILDMRAHFLERLQTAHVSWDSTFQMFSQFTSRFEDQSYEEIMGTVSRQCSTAKAASQAREIQEILLTNSDTRLSAFDEYIIWEKSESSKRHPFVFKLVEALYKRAILCYPANTELWEDYFMFLSEESVNRPQLDVDFLSVLDRSTRHCPWSGSLWSEYLLAAERRQIPFPDIGQIKHKATSTGLLDAGGLEEVLKVYVAWCSILRRRAFQAESTDEELDVAEVGIRSAIEDMQRLGEAKYGKGYQGDPNYRLERIYIKYFSQSGDWRRARESWKRLKRSRGDSYKFWLRYYGWEMSIWCKMSYRENATHAPSSLRPSEATDVLRTALQRPNLDWPEELIQLFENHLEDHEDAAEIQSAGVQIYKAKKAVKERRRQEIEAYEAAQAQAMQQAHSLRAETSADSAVGFVSSKRKRDDESNSQEVEGASKKTRGNDDGKGISTGGQPSLTSAEPKRDRENSTIIVRNLPGDATEKQVQQYFKGCGTINKILLEKHVDTTSATARIEFQSRDDALSAQTKDKKVFDGQEIQVQEWSEDTLWVTNYPPTADEAWIREKFENFGEIVEIRLPSLQLNTHRRFCYIQFKTADQAKSATELDGQPVGSTLKLVAKISNPHRRQGRVGALEEGREIHVRNLDWAVTEGELGDVFSRYGTVEQARIPRDLSGKSKGFAFVVLSTREEAKAALDMDNTKLKSRVMSVTIASKSAAKRQATTIIQARSQSSTSPSPDVAMTNGDQGTGTSPAPSANTSAKPSYAEIQDRTVALLNVPDTVNDARIRALAEPFGPLVKIDLRPDHQGAVLEYKNVADAGTAALRLEGFQITPGRFLGVGTVKEMRQQRAEKRNDRLGGNAGKTKEPTSLMQSTPPIRRPPQAGGRGGRRGLFVKGGGLGSNVVARKQEASNETTGTDANTPSGIQEQGSKSNADFRELLLGKKENA